MNFHHFGINVEDIDNSIAFYTQILGFRIITPKTKVDDKFPGVESHYYAYLMGDSGAVLELIQFCDKLLRKNKNGATPISPHLGLETDDFDATLKVLQNNNVEIIDGPHIAEGDAKYLTILDPDEYRIDIGQVLK
jgi:catechol 2,3-dioxygenase-like lactoylglutathione lyase family enzyme